MNTHLRAGLAGAVLSFGAIVAIVYADRGDFQDVIHEFTVDPLIPAGLVATGAVTGIVGNLVG